jgi:hypothetical protein
VGGGDEPPLSVYGAGDVGEGEAWIHGLFDADREHVGVLRSDLLPDDYEDRRAPEFGEGAGELGGEGRVVLGERDHVEPSPLREEDDVDRRRDAVGEAGVQVKISLDGAKALDGRRLRSSAARHRAPEPGGDGDEEPEREGADHRRLPSA